MNVNLKRVAALIATEVVFAGSFVAAGVVHLHGTAVADELNVQWCEGFTLPCVYRSDAPWIVTLPACAAEDCSDQPGQVGVWTSREGIAYIEFGEGVTIQVVDDMSPSSQL